MTDTSDITQRLANMDTILLNHLHFKQIIFYLFIASTREQNAISLCEWCRNYCQKPIKLQS